MSRGNGSRQDRIEFRLGRARRTQLSNEATTSDLPDWPTVDFSEFGPVERRPLGRIQSLTARFLSRNWIAIPHVTHHDEIDVTAFEERRIAWNNAHPDSKVTVMAPLAKAVAEALKAHPRFNTSLEADKATLVQKSYFNVGIAVDTPRGLLVAVLRTVDSKSIGNLGRELAELAQKARTKGLSVQEMAGGCITISSLGHIGGTGFTPIINAPEVAVLGVSRLQVRAAPAADGSVTWRKMLPLSLSYDHRVINGADAAQFVCTVANRLAAVDSFS